MIDTHAVRVPVLAAAALAAAPLASAAMFTDDGNSGDFFTINENRMAIFAPGVGGTIDGTFEVSFYTYDGDGSTVEDENATGTVEYSVVDPNLGLPPNEAFTGIELDTVTWDGRANFDGQTLDQIYFVQLSDDGVNFDDPIALAFTDPVVSSDIGFTLSTASASGFSANFVRIGIISRLEAAGSGFNDPWSSRIEEIRLTTSPIPEPGTLALGALGLALVGLRRRA
ncbi:MAG: PEP-CTERM sorting domain-containing protein [Planctomycetota bacterium]